MFNKNKLKAQMALSGITVKDLSKMIGINEATFYRKLQNDGSFSRAEINKMIEVLHIENPKEIFFA